MARTVASPSPMPPVSRLREVSSRRGLEHLLLPRLRNARAVVVDLDGREPVASAQAQPSAAAVLHGVLHQVHEHAPQRQWHAFDDHGLAAGQAYVMPEVRVVIHDAFDQHAQIQPFALPGGP